ncbi:MAG: hypothetical protein IT210_14735 [Armatimonadetes bacterium]|nr:hypothetical protein [Armatimonadota bacterium]
MSNRWNKLAVMLAIALAAAVVFSVVGWAAKGAPKAARAAKAPKEATVTGEVVDLWCYMDHKARGAGHKDCGIACAKAGNPIGIVDGKSHVYITFGSEKHQASKDQLIEHMADTVSVKGHIVRQGGLQGIYISDMKVVKNAS